MLKYCEKNSYFMAMTFFRVSSLVSLWNGDKPLNLRIEFTKNVSWIWLMDLYLYSTFLVLMTTQSSLQYSFTFTQSHTHSYSASTSSTLLFYEAQFGVQHLAQGHFGMQIFFDWGSNFYDHSTPSATAADVHI